MQKNLSISLAAAGMIAASLLIGVSAFAATNPMPRHMGMGGNFARPAVFGTVASVNGTTITVTMKAGPKGGTATTFNVDASSATVTKDGQASLVSNITVGDMVMVQGTVTGTNVVAKTIRDGMMPNTAEPQIQGDGQPVVAGTVATISGSTITITNNSKATYTVDASSAKFSVNGITNPTISNVAVGDNVVVQGTVNGTSIAASLVIDQKARVNAAGAPQKMAGGFMGGITSFFKHLFGF